jgi:molybdenum-dependent DNA-binding transcriptional regulator ModE
VSRDRQISYEALRDAVDEVRQRFGRTAVATAAELRESGIDVVTQRGRHAFGPEDQEAPK